MKLYINSNLISSGEISGLDSLQWSMSETGEGLERKVSGDIELTGAAFDFIKAQIIDNPAGLNVTLEVKVVEDCCDFAVLGVITAEGIRWCAGECKVNVTITEKADQLNCFKSTWIADDYPQTFYAPSFQSYPDHPKVPYCIELRPNFLQDLLFILGMMMNFQHYMMIPIIAIISVLTQAVCWVMNILGGNCPDELADGILDDYAASLEVLNKAIAGCGRKHPSPHVRDYITNACRKCGISFDSSIFEPTSPYYHLMMLYAPAKKGYFEGVDVTKNYIVDNAPYWTLEDLMNNLSPVFNAKYRLKNSVLRFERKDILTGTVIYDFTGADKDKLVSAICYKWNGKRRPAFSSFEYQSDAVDYVGNEARHRYNDIVDYNNPVNPAYSGQRKVTFMFGTSRFRNDGIERDVLSAYDHNIFFGYIIRQFENVLVMAQSTTYLPKLLIRDAGDPIYNARTPVYPTPSGFDVQNPNEDAPPPQVYNYPMMVDAVLNPTATNLYEFHKIDDSNLLLTKNYTFELQMKYSCGELAMLDDLIGSAVVTDIGTGEIQGWTIHFDTGTITLTGTV